MQQDEPFKFSPDQTEAVIQIKAWAADTTRPYLTMGGFAGTGKTTIISHLPLLISTRKIEYCAPTGKAARVLQSKLLTAGVDTYVKTIHQVIYRPFEVHCDNCPRQKDRQEECHATSRSRCGCEVAWDKKEGQSKPMLLVVDESSMIDRGLYDDLLSYMKGSMPGLDEDYDSGAKILFVGDHGQLPPISGKFNLMQNPDIRLERIHRQAEKSPILKVAQMARETGKIPFGRFGKRVVKLHENDAPAFDLDPDDTLMLCYQNAKRVAVNAQIRAALGFTGRPKRGERVICLKNNWNKGIYNGLTGTLVSVKRAEKARLDVVIDLDDGRRYEGQVSRQQFGQEATLLNVGCDLFDYGYCLTVHKAQGSSKRRVVLYEQHPHFIKGEAFRRWLYTAVTRAEKELIILA